MAARAWVLNLDADLELAAGGRYAPTRAVESRLSSLRQRVMHLVGPDDVVVDDPAKGDAAGLVGHAFCMTSRARARLIAAGALPVTAPPVDIIRHVNHRAFSAGLGEDMPGATLARTVRDVARAVAAIDSPLGALLKRPFGFAGRGQRRVLAVLSDADRAWLAATPVEEGVQVEPRVAIEVEHSVHGLIAEDGVIALGPVVIQQCDASGAWQRTRPATLDDLAEAETASALHEARRVADALCAAAYHGPFGVDGFVYTTPAGARRQRLRSGINARYTMGWSLR